MFSNWSAHWEVKPLWGLFIRCCWTKKMKQWEACAQFDPLNMQMQSGFFFFNFFFGSCKQVVGRYQELCSGWARKIPPNFSSLFLTCWDNKTNNKSTLNQFLYLLLLLSFYVEFIHSSNECNNPVFCSNRAAGKWVDSSFEANALCKSLNAATRPPSSSECLKLLLLVQVELRYRFVLIPDKAEGEKFAGVAVSSQFGRRQRQVITFRAQNY